MLRRNIIANFAGQAWAAAMSLAFIPLYIRYLGVDAYGIIGLFVVLQSMLALLDLGLTPTLNREMARFCGGAHDATSIRNMLRTAEVVACSCGAVACTVIWTAAPWLVQSWLKAGELDSGSTIAAFRVMGLCLGLRFIEGIYRSSIMGLQRQVLSNGIGAVLATLRGAGAIGVLAWVSPTLEAFFGWQAAIAALGVIVEGVCAYRLMPSSPAPARPSVQALHQMRGFAGGMIGISVLVVLLTQVDKILLSHLLTLTEYGYYTLAATVASGIGTATQPVGLAYLPRLTQLHAAADGLGLQRAFHQGSQLVSVLAGTLAIVAIVFADEALLVWTNDPELTQRVRPLLQVLMLANLLNAVMNMPYFAQLAHGWTGLTLKVNAVAVTLIVPAIMIVTPRYGAIGAAAVACVLSGGCALVGAPFMFRRILVGEQARWLLVDVAIPLAAAVITAIALRLALPLGSLGRWEAAIALLGAGCACAAAAALSTPSTRRILAAGLDTIAHRRT